MSDEQHSTGHNPLAIANCFVEKAVAEGRLLSILQLVKLVYLAHGWHLGYDKGPLISSSIQAWRHGPVVPEVYHEFRPQGVYSIMTTASDENGNVYKADLSEDERKTVNQVYDVYSRLPAFKLSDLTHSEGAPWAQTTGYYAPIPNDVIHAHYKKLVDDSRASGHE